MKNKKNLYDLSNSQKRVLYMEEVFPQTTIYNITGYMKINGTVNMQVLEQAINLFIKNNDGTRLRICKSDFNILQYISEYKKHSFEYVEFSREQNGEASFQQWLEGINQIPFQLYDEELFYVAMFKVHEEFTGFIAKFHHIISDGWSAQLLFNGVRGYYEDIIAGIDAGSKPKISYLQYLENEKQYKNSERFVKNREFFLQKFKTGKDEYFKYPEHIESNRLNYYIDSQLTAEIKRYIEKSKITMPVFFMAIYALFQSKIKNTKGMILGTPVFNRVNKTEKEIFGLFTSNLAVNIAFPQKRQLVEDYIKEIGREYYGYLKNQRYPYNDLITDLDIGRDGYNMLFDTCINYYNTKMTANMDVYKAEMISLHPGQQPYNLQLVITEWDNTRIEVVYDFNLAVYEPYKIVSTHQALMQIIRQVLDDVVFCSDIHLPCLQRGNGIKEEYYQANIVKAFEQQVEKTPEYIAISMKEESVTYRSLNWKINKLAYHLMDLLGDTSSIVGIICSHSIELFVAIWAVLKVGKSYVPIAADMPEKRLNMILHDCGITYILTNLEDLIHIEAVILNIQNQDTSQYSDSNPCNEIKANQLAYTIYTSGSTGQPKGVMITHANLMNYAGWASQMYLNAEKEVFACFTSFSFDLTVTSMFTPLIAGHEVRIFANENSGSALYDILAENRITIIKITPAHLQLICDIAVKASNLKTFIVGGEELKTSTIQSLEKLWNDDNIAVYNEYGPTETTVGCMIYSYSKKDFYPTVPIGIPISNTDIYILGHDLEPLPAGYAGEIYITGISVGKGYRGDEERTASAFLADPFRLGWKMYKSQDYGYALEHGAIMYLGRQDYQIKLNGYRIELAEIEIVLCSLEIVRTACVLLTGATIVAFVSLKTDGNIDTLLTFCQEQLPAYMVPNSFYIVDDLPVNANGKIDREKLMSYKAETVDMVSEAPINTEDLVSDVLLDIMKKVLKISRISLSDNFYQLSGDSIKAIQVSNQLSEMGYELPVKAILRNPDLHQMKKNIRLKNNKNSNRKKAVGELYPTPAMDWFIKSHFADKNYYHQSLLLSCDYSLSNQDINILVTALFNKHDSFHLRYDNNKKKFVFDDYKESMDQIIRIYNLQESMSEGEYLNEINHIGREIKSSFDINKGMLFKICIYRHPNFKMKILLIAHHLIIDAVSWHILIADIERLLEPIEEKQIGELENTKLSIQDYTNRYQTKLALITDNEINYWNNIVIAPTQEDRILDRKGRTLNGRRLLQCELNEVRTKQIVEHCCKVLNVNMEHLVLLALSTYLNHAFSIEYVTIELERHGRNKDDNTDLIGWFTNMFPLRLQWSQSIKEQVCLLTHELSCVPDEGISFGLLQMEHKLKVVRPRMIKVNYLGEYHFLGSAQLYAESFLFADDVSSDNLISNIFELNCLIQNGKFIISVSYNDGELVPEFSDGFLDGYLSALSEIESYCIKIVEYRVEPGQFELINLTQKDLDTILDYQL